MFGYTEPICRPNEFELSILFEGASVESQPGNNVALKLGVSPPNPKVWFIVPGPPRPKEPTDRGYVVPSGKVPQAEATIAISISVRGSIELPMRQTSVPIFGGEPPICKAPSEKSKLGWKETLPNADEDDSVGSYSPAVCA